MRQRSHAACSDGVIEGRSDNKITNPPERSANVYFGTIADYSRSASTFRCADGGWYIVKQVNVTGESKVPKSMKERVFARLNRV